MKALALDIDVSAVRRFREGLSKSPEIAREELRAATLESLMLLENLTKDNTPTGATALLRGAWASELLGEAAENETLGRVYNPMPYAAAIETGTRPHWAPLDPLIDWVRAKLDVQDEDEVLHVARLVQFKIAARGTPAQEPARRALDAAGPDIQTSYRMATERMMERIGF